MKRIFLSKVLKGVNFFLPIINYSLYGFCGLFIPQEIANFSTGITSGSVIGNSVDLLSSDKVSVICTGLCKHSLKSFCVSKLDIPFFNHISYLLWILAWVP